MSETFYIKKTAFDDNNFDLTQREADSFIIGPGELNGPGGLAQDSDLELYGFGAIKWGEGVNQNQYRQLENNACPEKVAGDFLKGTDDPDGFVAGTGSFVPNAGSPRNGAVPKDMYDLGIGNGITEALIGQLWYNTTQQVLYNFEPAGWTTVFREVTNELTDHINDGTVHLRGGQDTFLDGLILGGSPLSLQSDDVNRLIGMSSISGVTTVQGQLDLMVLRTGDIMTGNLSIVNSTADAILILRAPSSTNTSLELRSSTDVLRSQLTFNETSGDVSWDRRNAVGFPDSTLTLELSGNVSLTGTASVPTDDAHLTRRDFITDNYAPLVSPPLTGTPTAPTPTTSDNSTKIATTAFVQAQVDNNGVGSHSGAAGSIVVPAGVNMIEFLIIGGGGGGAGGGDGGDFTGHKGQVGGSTTITIPAVGSYSVLGGVGGRGTQGATITANNERRGGLGLSNPGAYGKPGNPGAGGHGGGSLAGRGGTGSAAFPAQAESGTFGGGGAGGWGQDNAAGEGGSSGNHLQFMANCTPGTTVTWSVGAGGAGGTYAGSTRRGGTGGNGYVKVRFSTWA